MARELPKASRIPANGKIKFELDIAPESETGNYQDVRECFEESGYKMNEKVTQIEFLIDEGFTSSWVSGAAPNLTYTGKYLTGNKLCEWLADKEFKVAEDRITNYRLTKLGKVYTGSCCIIQLDVGGGKAADGTAIAMVIALNGNPVILPESGSTSNGGTTTENGTSTETETNTDTETGESTDGEGENETETT